VVNEAKGTQGRQRRSPLPTKRRIVGRAGGISAENLKKMSALIFRIVKHDGAWAVEHEGRLSNRARDKDEVIASATKLARAAVGQGRVVQVRVEGETGYF
jgi:hypothetical protein